MHFLLAAGAALTAAVVATILTARGIAALRRRGWRRAAARLAGAAALSVHAWGMLHVLGAVLEAEDGGAGGSPLGPCRAAGERNVGQVVGYEVGYGWLSFDCRLSDGGTYATSAVPGWINPAAAGLGVTAVALAVPRTSVVRRSRPRTTTKDCGGREA